jgi:hypothetical protein
MRAWAGTAAAPAATAPRRSCAAGPLRLRASDQP